VTLTSERIAEIEKADWPHASPGYRTVDQSDLTELCALAKSALSTSGVKALEWRDESHHDGEGGVDWWMQADTPFGAITLTHNSRHTLPWLLEPFRPGLSSNFSTQDEAKAAAQADYEQRILSTLETAPAPAPAGDEEVEWLSRDDLGRLVRQAWIRWAIQQPEPKLSWLVPYDELSEPDKEADRQIGEALRSALRPRNSPRPCSGRRRGSSEE